MNVLFLALVVEIAAQPGAPPEPIDPADPVDPIGAPAAPEVLEPEVLEPEAPTPASPRTPAPAPDAPRKKRSARIPIDDEAPAVVDDDRPERILRGAVAGGIGAAAGAAALAAVLYVEAAAPGHMHPGVLLAAAAAAPGVAALAGGSLAIAFGMNAPTGSDFAWVLACTGIGYLAAVAVIVLIVAAPVGGSCLTGLLSCGPRGSGGPGACGGPSTSGPAGAQAAQPSDIPRAPLIVAGATAVISAAGMAIAGAAYWQDGAQSSRFLVGAATGAIVGAAVGGTIGGAAVGALSQ